jgi:hypothetical protein
MMKNYRIKKVTNEISTKYYPQIKILGLFWVNMFGHPDYGGGSYRTFEEAQKAVCDYLREPVIEYLNVDCGEIK